MRTTIRICEFSRWENLSKNDEILWGVQNVIESMEKDRGLPLWNRMWLVLICIPYAAIRIWVSAQFNTDFLRGFVRTFCCYENGRTEQSREGQKWPTPLASVGHFLPLSTVTLRCNKANYLHCFWIIAADNVFSITLSPICLSGFPVFMDFWQLAQPGYSHWSEWYQYPYSKIVLLPPGRQTRTHCK